jgi:hypothetical protein
MQHDKQINKRMKIYQKMVFRLFNSLRTVCIFQPTT